MKHEEILQLDPIIHAPTRLAILSILITVENATFPFLKESIAFSNNHKESRETPLFPKADGYSGLNSIALQYASTASL